MHRETTHPYIILFTLWLLVFSASSQIMIIAPMLPRIGAQLDIPEALQGTLVSAYAVMVGVFAVTMGPVSDRIGRRRILLAGTGLMTVALVLHAAAFNYPTLLLLRALAGAAGGVLSGSAVSYVGDYFPYERRGWANGWIMSSTALGQILGVPMGTVLAGWYGFHVPFLAFGVTMAATFVLVWFCVPQPPVRLSAGSLTPASMLRRYAALMARPAPRAGAIAFFLMFLGISSYVIYLPTWLASARGATEGQVASLFLVGGIANAMTGPLAGRLSDQIGRRWLIILSCVGLSIVMLSTTVVVRELWMAYPLFFATMVFVAARMSPFQALLSALAADEERGTFMSMSIALGQVGFAAGGALAGPIYTQFGYASNTVLGAVSVLLMAALVWGYLPEPGRPAVDLDASSAPETTG